MNPFKCRNKNPLRFFLALFVGATCVAKVPSQAQTHQRGRISFVLDGRLIIRCVPFDSSYHSIQVRVAST